MFAVICRYGNDASEPSEHAAFIKRRCESGGASHYEWYSTHGAIEVVPEKDILNFPVCLAFYKQTQGEDLLRIENDHTEKSLPLLDSGAECRN